MISIQLAGRTDVGNARDRNEDEWAADEDLGVVVVADGMGGHPAGGVASRLAVQALLSSLATDEPEPASSPASEDRGAGERMAEAVREANRQILRHTEEHPTRQGMGTTLTALRIDRASESFQVGHVGDSRAYVIRDGSLTPLTHDDTPLQREVEAGSLSREEARVHPLGHVLSQALGTTSEVDPEIVEGRARPGDLFLLCSDGLTAVLSEDRIEGILREAGDAEPEEVAERLIRETLEGGAPDNVTVALVRVEEGG